MHSDDKQRLKEAATSANPWRRRLAAIAGEHGEDGGLDREADGLAAALPLVHDELTFRVALASACWWREENLDEVCAEVRATIPAGQRELRLVAVVHRGDPSSAGMHVSSGTVVGGVERAEGHFVFRNRADAERVMFPPWNEAARTAWELVDVGPVGAVVPSQLREVTWKALAALRDCRPIGPHEAVVAEIEAVLYGAHAGSGGRDVREAAGPGGSASILDGLLAGWLGSTTRTRGDLRAGACWTGRRTAAIDAGIAFLVACGQLVELPSGEFRRGVPGEEEAVAPTRPEGFDLQIVRRGVKIVFPATLDHDRVPTVLVDVAVAAGCSPWGAWRFDPKLERPVAFVHFDGTDSGSLLNRPGDPRSDAQLLLDLGAALARAVEAG